MMGTFNLAASHCTDRDAEEVEPFMDYLAEEVLSGDGGPPALGLVYHLADCYMPELLAADAVTPVPPAALALLLSPFSRLLAEARSTASIARVTCVPWS